MHLKSFCVPLGAFFEDIRQPNLNFIAALRFLLDVPATADSKHIYRVIKTCRWILVVRGHEMYQVGFFDAHDHNDNLFCRIWQLEKVRWDFHEALVVIVCDSAQLIVTSMLFQKFALVSSEQHTGWTALVPKLPSRVQGVFCWQHDLRERSQGRTTLSHVTTLVDTLVELQEGDTLGHCSGEEVQESLCSSLLEAKKECTTIQMQVCAFQNPPLRFQHLDEAWAVSFVLVQLFWEKLRDRPRTPVWTQGALRQRVAA